MCRETAPPGHAHSALFVKIAVIPGQNAFPGGDSAVELAPTLARQLALGELRHQS